MEKKGSVREISVQEIDLKHGGMVRKQRDGVEMKQGGETALTENEVHSVIAKGRKKSKDKKKRVLKEKTRWSTQ